MNNAAIAIGRPSDPSKLHSARNWREGFGRGALPAALWVLIGYYFGAKLGFALTIQPRPVSVLWPPNSILVAALLLTPPRSWWLLLLAALPAHWIAQLQSNVPPAMILCWFVSNSCEALIGAGAARLLIGQPMRFDRLRNVGVFCLCVVMMGPILSSFLDAGFVIWNHFGHGAYWEIWRIRTSSNVLAALTVAPFIVTWATEVRTSLLKKSSHYLEGALLLAALLVIGWLVLYKIHSGHEWFLPYLPLPFLIWAAVRFGSLGASTAVGIITLLTIWSAAHGEGAFSTRSPAENALSIQIFLIVLSVPILFLGTLIEELASGETDRRESEARFRVAADVAPVMVWTTAPDKSCTYVNKAWREFTGRTLEENLGDGWAHNVHPEDRETCLRTHSGAFDARQPFNMKYRLLRHDRTYRVVTDSGIPHFGPHGTFRGYIGACVDVTDLLEQQEALHGSEERVALATDAAHLGVWERDLVNNNFWISDKARELFGFDSSEPVTYSEFRERTHPEDLALSDLARNRAIETKGGYEIEYRALLRDGTVRWIAGRARCVLDDNGNVARLLGVLMNITERKVAAEQARKSREEIDRLMRISLLGEMTGSIAHELNQPLSGILSNASAGQRFIDRGDVDLAIIREILVDIAADGRRASDVIGHIRNTIKKGAAIRERINLNEVVGRVAHMVQPDTVANSCELQLSLAENLPEVEGDPIQIQQVLINLVKNAFDAMRQIPIPQRKVKIITERNGDSTVKVSVSDRGTGVSGEIRDHLFDQFFTTKEEGLGMGLAIVRSIIESHGGAIDVKNVNEGGACFYFTLPATMAAKK
jgi:PAS domain S-box-containing protein